MVLLCGVEEAGRGPVIGPLVMCGVIINEEDELKLKAMGAKDSKLLTPKAREFLFDKIKNAVMDYKIIIVPPKEIDDAVEGKGGINLNWLEANKSAEIINLLKPNKAILDCPSTNISAYSNYVQERVDKKVVLVCAHHADVNFPVVSAASILAKVTRDAEIKKLKKKIGIDFGSGYPSDPTTKEFLKEHYMDFPNIIRHSWAPYKNLIKQKAQKNLGNF